MADTWQVWIHGQVYIILLLVIIYDAKSLILNLLFISLLLLSYLSSIIKVIKVYSLLPIQSLRPHKKILGRPTAHTHVMLINVSVGLRLLHSESLIKRMMIVWLTIWVIHIFSFDLNNINYDYKTLYTKDEWNISKASYY